MSKKTRKKSSRVTAAVKAAAAGRTTSAKAPAKATAKATATKTRKAIAAPSGKAPRKASNSASLKASHKAASKPLKSGASAAAKSAAPVLVEGAPAPSFDLPRDGGGHVSSVDHTGKKLVLFFYPRADTPGCTREAIDFTRLKDEFAAADAQVLGISADTVKAQDSFRNKHQLAIPLISDEQHEMLEAYGAWGEKSMYGKKFFGILRTTVLVGADGRIAKIWRNVRVDGHADEVLAAARQL
jgi:thioredoxin-dependent peroxiredoxin